MEVMYFLWLLQQITTVSLAKNEQKKNSLTFLDFKS